MINNLFFDILKITEQTAIACKKVIGNQDQYHADFIAVEKMRELLNQSPFQGKIVIGEGERDKAPMLYIGEILGTSCNVELDVAVDPLEGTKLCAYNQEGAMSVIAVGTKGSILHAPDVYMEKIAVGPNIPSDVVDLDETIENNLKNLAKFSKKNISELKVIVLNRPRHEELITRIIKCGANLELIEDGDITAVISTSYGTNRNDLYIGTGGAPEGVLAAAALKTIGGNIFGRLIFENKEQILRAQSMGITNLHQKLSISDMIKGDIIFSATAITSNRFLQGIKHNDNILTTESFITSSYNNEILIAKRDHL